MTDIRRILKQAEFKGKKKVTLTFEDYSGTTANMVQVIIKYGYKVHVDECNDIIVTL